MIDELLGGFFSVVKNLVVYIVYEILFELAVRSVGYWICRPFGKVNPDGFLVVLIGLAFWILTGGALIFLFTN
ncbi:MAG: hypothetical protein HWE24_19280 [Oceanospirillaceae bacterium]|nr:hypothetical protein [Oceanospirillaceae bacterium]